MQNIPILKDNDYSGTNPRPYMITLVNLYFLDGSMHPLKLYIPRFTNWLDALELTEMYLSPLICYWCKYWLKIKSYQVHIGSIDPATGEEVYTITYEMVDIPLNKVFMPSNPRGEWIDPEAEKQINNGERLKQMIRNMDAGKHPIDGAEVVNNPEAFGSWNN